MCIPVNLTQLRRAFSVFFVYMLTILQNFEACIRVGMVNFIIFMQAWWSLHQSEKKRERDKVFTSFPSVLHQCSASARSHESCVARLPLREIFHNASFSLSVARPSDFRQFPQWIKQRAESQFLSRTGKTDDAFLSQKKLICMPNTDNARVAFTFLC